MDRFIGVLSTHDRSLPCLLIKHNGGVSRILSWFVLFSSELLFQRRKQSKQILSFEHDACKTGLTYMPLHPGCPAMDCPTIRVLILQLLHAQDNNAFPLTSRVPIDQIYAPLLNRSRLTMHLFTLWQSRISKKARVFSCMRNFYAIISNSSNQVLLSSFTF
jgi:hypothetical protein